MQLFIVKGFGAALLMLFSLHSLAKPLRLATWNMEWLMTPSAYEALAPLCNKGRQPESHERQFPCASNRGAVPQRTMADFNALAEVAKRIPADVVALQEVDGPEPAAMVFGREWTLDCFISRLHPQKVGFAIRKGIPYQCNPEYSLLDADGRSRAGADITLYPHTPQAVRLLSVHLKSGCFAGPLSGKGSCPGLQRQVPLLERWVDARAQAGEAYALLGDFNRRLEKDADYPAGPDELAPLAVFNALSDQTPAGASLVRATEHWTETLCSPKDKYTQGAIDNILISERLAKTANLLKVQRVAYTADEIAQFRLPDHCPLVMALEP